MAIHERLYTVEAFEAFVRLPENSERSFKYVGGEIIVVPSSPYASNIASRINRRMGNWAEVRDLGYVTDGQGG